MLDFLLIQFSRKVSKLARAQLTLWYTWACCSLTQTTGAHSRIGHYFFSYLLTCDVHLPFLWSLLFHESNQVEGGLLGLKHYPSFYKLYSKMENWIIWNPTIFNIIRWVAGTNDSLTKRLMFQVLFFFHNFLQNSLQKSFQFIYFIFIYNFTKIKI